MPDTKSGRERKGRNKRQQLESHLTRRELDTLDGDHEPALYEEDVDSEFLASPSEVEELRASDD